MSNNFFKNILQVLTQTLKKIKFKELSLFFSKKKEGKKDQEELREEHAEAGASPDLPPDERSRFKKIKAYLTNFAHQSYQKLIQSKDSQNHPRPPASLYRSSGKLDFQQVKNYIRFYSLEFFNIAKNKTSDFLDQSVSSANRPRIHQVFVLSAFIALSYFSGKMLGLLLSAKTSSTADRENSLLMEDQATAYGPSRLNLLTNKNFMITSLNLPNDKNGPQGKKPDESQKPLICHESDEQTNLPFKLLDTTVIHNSQKSVASVEYKNKVLNLREGEKIEGEAEIGKIDRLKVVLKNLKSGKCEFISNREEFKFFKDLKIFDPQEGQHLLPQNQMKGIKNIGNNYSISRSVIKEKLQDVNTIFYEARAIQMANPDGTFSFKIVEIEPGSIYSHLGIKNNDIIKSINGKKITSLNEVMNLFGNLTGLNNLSLTVEDNEGNENTLEYEFN